MIKLLSFPVLNVRIRIINKRYDFGKRENKYAYSLYTQLSVK